MGARFEPLISIPKILVVNGFMYWFYLYSIILYWFYLYSIILHSFKQLITISMIYEFLINW